MATQSTVISDHDVELLRENTRKLTNIRGNDIPFTTFFGDAEDTFAGGKYVKDWNLPSGVTDDEIAGEAVGTTPPNFVATPEPYVNYMQMFAPTTGVQFSKSGEAVPGRLGELSQQEEELMDRIMMALEVIGVSNQATGKPSANTDPAQIGSPMTYIRTGNQMNLRASGSVNLSGGGYDSTAETTSHIVDATVTANRGSVTVAKITEAMGLIYRTTRGSAGPGESPGTTASESRTFACFLPTTAYGEVFSGTQTGVADQNRYTSMIGGNLLRIATTVKVIQNQFGICYVFPVAEQKGDATNNNFGILLAGMATKLIYKRRIYTERLRKSAIDDEAVARCAATWCPPHERLGVVFGGIKQDPSA